MATIAEQLAALAAAPTDTLKPGTPANFTKIPWANTAGVFNETKGWEPPGFISGWEAGSAGGIYYNPGKVKAPTATQVIRNEGATDPAGRQWGVWACMSATAKPTGYQAIALGLSAVHHKIVVREWNEGVLVNSAEIELELMSTLKSGIAIVVAEEKVTAWYRQEEGGAWKEGPSIASTSFTEGYAGVDGNGSNPFLINFARGAITGQLTGAAKLPLGTAITAKGQVNPVLGAATLPLKTTITAAGTATKNVAGAAALPLGIKVAAIGEPVVGVEGSVHLPLATSVAAAGVEVPIRRGAAAFSLGTKAEAAGVTFPTHQKVRFNFEIEPTVVNFDAYG